MTFKIVNMNKASIDKAVHIVFEPIIDEKNGLIKGATNRLEITVSEEAAKQYSYASIYKLNLEEVCEDDKTASAAAILPA